MSMSMSLPDHASQPPSQRSEPAPEQNEPAPDRKPPQLSWESFADRRIREASEAGAFANLPGLGQPIPGIDEPLNENW